MTAPVGLLQDLSIHARVEMTSWPLAPPWPPVQVVHQTMKLVRAMTLQRGDTLGEVTRDNSIDFGADLLAAFPNVHLNVVLQVTRGRAGRVVVEWGVKRRELSEATWWTGYVCGGG